MFKQLGVASVLFVAAFMALGTFACNQGSSSVSGAGGAQCQFLNNDTDNGLRSQHLNNYNVCTTAQYMSAVIAAEPYPQALIKDSLERKQQIEKLLRFQDRNKIGWIYNLGMAGNVISQFVISGKPSSTQSSLTATSQAWDGGTGKIEIPSPGDDGSYGPNEGGDAGILYFTAAGCMIEQAPGWIYSDCQLNISPQAIITGFVNINNATGAASSTPVPSSNAGCLDGTNTTACKGQ